MSHEKIQNALCGVLRDMGVVEPTVQLKRPRDPRHGDVASNVAMTLARELKRAPRQIAEQIVEHLDLEAAGIEAVEIAGPGFLNFRLSSGVVASVLPNILAADEAWGRSETGAGARVMVEFVSANPTGPLHIGHGRQAALGDAICSLLTWTGWDVHREFYYNDGGRQMELLALSVYSRYLEHFGDEAEVPEGGYHGGYIAEIAQRLADDVGEAYRDGVSEQELDEICALAVRILRAEQDRDLGDFGVIFDEYYLESSLYSEGRVDGTIQALKDTGLVYEHEGATWLKTTEFGDQKDRVMVRSNGLPTYFVPDIAYHLHKWQRGFHRVINVQGSDHHGTVDRVRAGTRALGLPEGYPEYVLHQMVRVTRDGHEVKFSKRAGSALSVRELYDEVGVDVTRYFFQMRKPDAQMLFDVDAALDQSDTNPVYKVQYAHARMCSIFAKAEIKPESIEAGTTDLSVLDHELERELVKNLREFTEVLERSARQSTPHALCEYLEQTASSTNGWYHAGNPTRNSELAVLTDDDELRRARLILARAVQIVLRNGLTILGISAPIRMDRTVLEGTADEA
jgi:arginyl-tRNA synthetase